MALLLIDGFEQYDDQTEINRGGWIASDINHGIIIQGRAGAGSQAAIMAFTSGSLKKALPSAPVTFTCGFAYILRNGGPQNVNIVEFLDVGTIQIALRTNTSGELEIRRGTTQLAITSGLGLTSGIWYHIEVKVTINNTTGVFEVRLDGSAILGPTSSQDTQNSANALINTVSFPGHSTPDPGVDDFYILDDVGADNTSFLGDCTVETVFPDADGATNNFTAVGPGTTNADRVDDGLVPDDDTSYVHSSTVTNKDLYGFAALTGNIGEIFAVGVALLVRKEDSGFREIATVARSNVTEVDSGNKTLGVGYQYRNHIYENDPNGGINWAEAAVNAAQFGIKLTT